MTLRYGPLLAGDIFCTDGMSKRAKVICSKQKPKYLDIPGLDVHRISHTSLAYDSNLVMSSERRTIYTNASYVMQNSNAGFILRHKTLFNDPRMYDKLHHFMKENCKDRYDFLHAFGLGLWYVTKIEWFADAFDRRGIDVCSTEVKQWFDEVCPGLLPKTDDNFGPNRLIQALWDTGQFIFLEL